MGPMPSVKIYGISTCDTTRDARRHFRESNTSVRYHDLARTTMDAVEFNRFLTAFPLAELIDTAGSVYNDLLGKRSNIPDDELFSAIVRTPNILQLPLVRCGNRLAIGGDSDGWDRIVAAISS